MAAATDAGGPVVSLRQAQDELAVATAGPGLYEITAPIARWVEARTIGVGLLTVFCRHTSASLLIQENADPEVASDIADYFAALAPEDMS